MTSSVTTRRRCCSGKNSWREDARRLGESVGQNKRFRLVHLRMLAVLDRWNGDTEGAIRHLREGFLGAPQVRRLLGG